MRFYCSHSGDAIYFMTKNKAENEQKIVTVYLADLKYRVFDLSRRDIPRI